MTERARIASGLAAEVAFAVLPLLIVLLFIVSGDLPQISRFFASPEWSFGSAILIGQSLVKFVSGIGKGGSAAAGPVALVISLVLVFLLAPTLFVLFLSLQAESKPSPWLGLAQVILFALAAGVYILLGLVGELWNVPKQAGEHD
jgi:hypothetical protein